MMKLSKRKHKWLIQGAMFVMGGLAMFTVMNSLDTRNTGVENMEQKSLENLMELKSISLIPNVKAKIDQNKLLPRQTINAQTQTLHQHRRVQKTQPPRKPVKILCFVKTQPKNYATRAIVVKNTWGKRCDKLLFMSSKSDPKLPAIGLFDNETIVESRKLLTQKVFKAIKYVTDHYLNEYDWFHEADDDTYIIIDNLRAFLSTKNRDHPVYYGHIFHKYVPQGYTSGGAGYVMSREALKRIRDRGPKERLCHTTGPASDAHMGHCLNAVGVKLGRSVDSKGRSRYHCFDIESFIHGGFPKWYKNYTATADGYKADWIADYPISFHYVSPAKMYTMDLLLHQTRIHGESGLPRPALD